MKNLTFRITLLSTILVVLTLTSCADDMEMFGYEYLTSTGLPGKAESAEVTFEMYMSPDLFDYYEVSAVYNNELATDIVQEDIYQERFVHTYKINKLPQDVPVQVNYRRTNRPIPSGKEITISMVETIKLKVDGNTITKVVSGEKTIRTGGAGPRVNDGVLFDLINKFHNFGLKIANDGSAILYDEDRFNEL